MQQEDLVYLGKVVLALACNTVMAIQRDNFQNSMELIARSYSADLKNFFLSVYFQFYVLVVAYFIQPNIYFHCVLIAIFKHGEFL